MMERAEHYVIANGNRVAVEDGDRDLSVAVGFALPANSHPTHAVSPRSVAPESLTHAATIKSQLADARPLSNARYDTVRARQQSLRG